MFNRGYASSCRINRDKEKAELQLNIEQEGKDLLHKKAQLEQEKMQLCANVALYRETFRSVSNLYNDRRANNMGYYYNADADFDEDLFDTDDDDDDDEDEEDNDIDTNRTIVGTTHNRG